MSTSDRVTTPGMKHCYACDNEIPERARICTHCNTLQVKLRRCNVCKELIPKSATVCNHCKNHRGWLGDTSVASISAIFIALAALVTVVTTGMIPLVSYIQDRESHTRFKVTSSSKTEIYLKAWNTGRQPSTLLGYRLRFDKLPLSKKEVMLDLSPFDKAATSNVIAPGAPAVIRLLLPLPDAIPKRRRADQCTPEERKRMLLRDSSMTLEIDVEESSDGDGQFQTRKDRFPPDRIAAFIKEQWWDDYGK